MIPERTKDAHIGMLRNARVVAMDELAPDIRLLEIAPLDGVGWPAAEAGAHIDLVLPNGLVRQYSIINPGEPDRYKIAILREAGGRGGSAYIFDELNEGDELPIGGPRNNFPLSDSGRPVCLIAGGIGITPLLAMARVVAWSDIPWRLYYCIRDRHQLAFGGMLKQFGPNVVLHVDSEKGGPPDLEDIIKAEQGSDFYCCGPAPMLDAFRKATASLPADRVHLESFDPVAESGATNESFEIELATTGTTLVVPPDKSIMTVLEEAGVAILYSCRNGQCGTCETAVLEGVPDHRDSLLTEQERQEGKTMMVCCSRAKTPKLVLDL
ncbi:PDR/VanB family oxidoreductase [Amorphus sp. MBR-141]